MRGLMLMVVTLIAMAAPAYADSDKCVDVRGIANKQVSSVVHASFTSQTSLTGSIFTYTFSGDPTVPLSSGGIPGLISYCVYPAQGFLPDGGIAINYDEWRFAARR